MGAGLGVLIWGGFNIVSGDTQHLISGSIVATIGGALSGYITKTFLDVHRLSLLQLNHYFRQPVLNSQILNAQRLADLLNGEARQRALESIVARVCDLIDAERAKDAALEFHAESLLPGRRILRQSTPKTAQDRDQLSKPKQDGEDQQNRKPQLA
jgi:hypothetical protein